MLIFDAHLDLAMNAIEWNRDLASSIDDIRAREAGQADKPDRGRGTVSFAEMRRGGIGLCVATQIARYVRRGNSRPGWHSPEQAWAMTQAQLAWYRSMEERGELASVTDLKSLDRQLARWNDEAGLKPADAGLKPCPTGGTGDRPIGYVLSLEGADSLVTLGHLERAYAAGLRALGPAHYGPGTYAAGTESEGGFSARGFELLAEMDRLGMILDVTHLTDQGFWEALDRFQGPVWASHSNVRVRVPHQRQLDDEMIRALVARGGVIGAVLDAWMLVPGWQRGVSTPEAEGVTLQTLVEHIDHVCQVAGSARHAGIGSDLDGAFGREQTATDLRTIGDLRRLSTLLSARGYSAADIEGIMHGNFLRRVREAWSR
jgi:membrane dipeptidase